MNIFQENGRFGAKKADGTVVVPPVYEEGMRLNNDRVLMRKGKDFLRFNSEGKHLF